MASKIGMLDDKDAIGFCTYHSRHHYTRTSCPHLQEGVYAMNLLAEAWRRLDSVVIMIMLNREPAKQPTLKARAQGMAEILAVITPGFDSVDAVSAEAGKRHAMREAGTPYSTPGIRGDVNLKEEAL